MPGGLSICLAKILCRIDQRPTVGAGEVLDDVNGEYIVVDLPLSQSELPERIQSFEQHVGCLGAVIGAISARPADMADHLAGRITRATSMRTMAGPASIKRAERSTQRSGVMSAALAM